MSDPRHPSPAQTLPALSQFDFHARLAETPGTALVMFTSPDCGGCRHLRRVLGEVHRLQPGWQIFEVDAQRDQALTHEFEIFHLPTLFVFRDGDFHCQLQAEARPAAIIAAVGLALQQPPQEAP